MTFFPQKDNSPDFSKEEVQNSFIHCGGMKELLQKEMDVNLAEQVLLKQRIELMKNVVNSVPSYDPDYAKFAVQMRMDQIELDELRVRETLLSEKLKEI